MRGVIRTWTVWLLAFMLPLQAMAGSLMRCEHTQGSAPAQALYTSAAQSDSLSAEPPQSHCHPAPELPSQGSCSACAACCSPAAALPFVSTPIVLPTLHAVPHLQQPKPVHVPRDALERPPRSTLG